MKVNLRGIIRIIRYRTFYSYSKNKDKNFRIQNHKTYFCQPGEFEGAPSSKNFVSNSELISFLIRDKKLSKFAKFRSTYPPTYPFCYIICYT